MPTDWIVKFVSVSSSGSERVDAQVVLQSLDFNYPGVRSMTCAMTRGGSSRTGWWTFLRGTLHVSFEHDGEARLFVDGREAAYEPDSTAPQDIADGVRACSRIALIADRGPRPDRPLKLKVR